MVSNPMFLESTFLKGATYQRIKLSPQIIVFILFGKKILFYEMGWNNKPKLDQKGKTLVLSLIDWKKGHKCHK